MNLDFIEIGTSNFWTLIQSCDDTEHGISIEPVRHYLDSLPNRPNVVKVCAAITGTKLSDTVDIYYIPEDVINERGFYDWFKGCNSINTYHPLHVSYGLTDYVKIDTIPLLTMEDVYDKFNIQTIKHLKIDTEGHDCNILQGLFQYLKAKCVSYYPQVIHFESNEWTPVEVVDQTIAIAESIGYEVVKRGYDTTLRIKTSSSNIESE
jgi:FkbM family methyltransferase